MVHKGLWCLAFSNFFIQKSNRVVASDQINFSAKEKRKNSLVKQKWLRPKKAHLPGPVFTGLVGQENGGWGSKARKVSI